MAAPTRSDPDFGARMRQAREARGVSLRQIAEITKISVSALEALERNDITRLPGGIFSRGFVRSYASEIGVDPEQTVQEFLLQFPNESVSVATGASMAADDLEIGMRRLDPRAVVLLGTVALGVAVILFWSLAAH